MTEKRFTLSKDTEWWFVQDKTIQVNEHGYREDLTGEDKYLGLKKELTEEETVDLLNKLNDECEFLEIENESLEDATIKYTELYYKTLKENERLKQLIKELERQIHLTHMSSMFSTVKSFKGDVSKRYKYSEETDTIYDTANTYGQYNKILDKKEVVMLLNEYETLLKSDLND